MSSLPSHSLIAACPRYVFGDAEDLQVYGGTKQADSVDTVEECAAICLGLALEDPTVRKLSKLWLVLT